MAYNPKKTKAYKLQREKSLNRLEKMILRGVTNHSELAAAFGVTTVTIRNRIKVIEERWDKSSNKGEHRARIKRIKQFEHIAFLALNSYETSKQDSQEFITKHQFCGACNGLGIRKEGRDVPDSVRRRVLERDGHKCVECGTTANLNIDHILPRSKGGSHNEDNLQVLCFKCNREKSDKIGLHQQCDKCDGVGKIEDEPGNIKQCPVCDGTAIKPDLPVCGDCGGKGSIEITTTKVKGQAGDPKFLTIAKQCVQACTRLEGTIIAGKGPMNGLSIHQRITKEAEGIGGEIERKTQELYLEAPVDLILDAKVTLEKIRESMQKGESKQIIEADFVKHKNEESEDDSDSG